MDDRAAGGDIVDGWYNLKAQPGEEKSRNPWVSTLRQEGVQGRRPGRKYVPANYNDKTELQAEVTTSSSENKKLDFALKLK